jgi:hypothetical protein
VPRFLLQGVASLLVVGGLALLDLGAQARAGLISISESGPVTGAMWDDLAPAFGERSPQPEPQAFPPPPAENSPVGDLPAVTWSFAGGGTGPRVDSPTPSTASVNFHAGLLADHRHGPPRLVGLLCVLHAPPVGDPPPSSIFRPPRPSQRSHLSLLALSVVLLPGETLWSRPTRASSLPGRRTIPLD